MRVLISSFGRPLNPQLRTYAEYRIFSTLATHDNVVGARVRLHTEDDAVQCTVHVTLSPRGSVHAHTSGAHAAAAIDRAAERLAELMAEQRTAVSM